MATIGIDVTALSVSTSGGIGTSQHKTMLALADLPSDHRFIMYAAKPPLIPFSGRPLDLPWELRLGSGPSTRSNILWMQTGVNAMLAQDNIDLFWSPRHLLPLRTKGIAKVATIQDLWHRHFPRQQPLLNRTLNRELIERVIAQSDRVVTTSQATADDVIRFHTVSPNRVDVVELGVDMQDFSPNAVENGATVLARLGILRPFLLSLDVFNPRKNFSAVLNAYSMLPESLRAEVDVVGVGRPRKTASETDPTAQAADLGISASVHIVDDVAFDELRVLYSSALTFIYPSVYEGFGMPVLEAMASGCPVVTSNSSSLPEVAGDAAILVDPTSAEGIASVLLRVIEDSELRGELRAAGLARAAHFTWRRTADGMLASFERALEAFPQGVHI